MKKIFVSLLLIISFVANAQDPVYGRFRWRWGGTFDSVLVIPRDTVSSAPIGAIASPNDKFYIKKSSGWSQITAGGPGGGFTPEGSSSQLITGDGNYITRNGAAVGLNLVDNISDLNKPLSNASVTALLLKMNLTKWVTDSAALKVLIDANTSAITGKQATITTGTTGQYFRGDLSLATFPTIPTNTNQLTNGAGFITSSDLSPYAPLASPVFTGTPKIGSDTVATKAYARSLISGGGAVLYSGTGSNTDGAMTQDATTTALALKAPIASPTFTGTVGGITKSMVGLGSVDNTTDAGKPVSTAQQTALDLKANLAGPTFTGTVVLPSTTSIGTVSATEIGYVDGLTGTAQTQIDGKQPLDADLTTIAGLTPTTNNFIVSVSSAWASRTPAQVKTTLSLDNVDNTSDATKNSATATITNKTISGSSNTITNIPDAALSANVPLINADNIFTGSNRFQKSGQQVVRMSQSSFGISLSDVAFSESLVFNRQSTYGEIYTTSNHPLLLQSNGGNIGIANNSPSELLSLGSSGSSTLGVLSLSGNTSGKVIIQPAAVAGSWTMTLPTSGGTSGYFLSTNGSGVTSWSNALGTPASGTLTNATGLPISTGVSGLGTGVATFLATPSSANLATAVTNETGSGALVFGTSPALTTPDLGTPSAVTLTNGTGLPQAGVTNLVSDLAAKAPLSLTLNAQTASYTLVLTDAGKLVTMSNASANNLTVPLNSSVAYPTGTQITIVSIGAGQTTIVATGGVTINSAGGALKLRVQYSSVTLIKTGTDTWLVLGDLTT